jgi:hypothetical protein
VSIRGATKAIKKHQWAECIRFVAAEKTVSQTVLSVVERNSSMKARYGQFGMEKICWIPEIVVLD